jgi:hypothetical protein
MKNVSDASTRSKLLSEYCDAYYLCWFLVISHAFLLFTLISNTQNTVYIFNENVYKTTNEGTPRGTRKLLSWSFVHKYGMHRLGYV